MRKDVLPIRIESFVSIYRARSRFCFYDQPPSHRSLARRVNHSRNFVRHSLRSSGKSITKGATETFRWASNLREPLSAFRTPDPSKTVKKGAELFRADSVLDDSCEPFLAVPSVNLTGCRRPVILPGRAPRLKSSFLPETAPCGRCPRTRGQGARRRNFRC
jgi:hypothetical protein